MATTITSQQIGLFYDQMAPYFSLVWGDNLHVGYWPPETPEMSLTAAQEQLTDLMISRTLVGPGQKVLDLGCGVGWPALRLAEKTGCEVVGITISQTQLVAAKRSAQERGLAQQVTFQHMDAMHLAFAEETFDAVWAFESLFHMPDRTHVLCQVGRVLRPGGRLLICDFYERTPLTPETATLETEFYCVNSRITPNECRAMLLALGFFTKEVKDISENLVKFNTLLTANMLQKGAALKALLGDEFLVQMQYMKPMMEELEQKIGYYFLVAEKISV